MSISDTINGSLAARKVIIHALCEIVEPDLVQHSQGFRQK